MSETILLVEDDLKFGSLCQDFLRDSGYEVSWERRGDRARSHIISKRPDLVILDLMLPGEDGLSVCKSIRADYDGSILMLTARRSTVDQIQGLDMGADDYVLKPIEPQLLLARVRALLRRTPNAHEPQPDMVSAGELVLDRTRYDASYRDQSVELTSSEFNILWIIVRDFGRVVSREVLFREALGTRYDGIDRGVDIHMSRIRKKLEAVGFERQHLKAVRGEGYLLTPS